MIKVALKGLLGRKLRTALTALAIVLGVAMVSGTFVLTDSIDKAFNTIFTEVRQGSNVVVSGKSAFTVSQNGGSATPTIHESLLEKVRALPDVAQAEGGVNGQAQLIGKNGKAIVFGGAPNLGFSIANGDSPFNPLTLTEGHWPHGDEVVIDKATAGKKHFAVGETIGVQAEGPVKRLPDLRDRQVRLGRDDRRRDARRLRPADRPAVVRQAGPARRDRGRGEAGRLGREAAEGGASDPAADGPGQVRPEQQAAADARTRTRSSRSCAASCSRSAGSPCSSAAS